MTRLILGAVEEEVAQLRNLQIASSNIEIHTIGIGAVSAAISTTRLLLEHRGQNVSVLFVGSVGAYDEKVEPLSLVIGSRSAQMDASSALKQGFIPQATPTSVDANAELTTELQKQLSISAHDAGVCSPLSITTNRETANRIADASDCGYENLELFGVALASQLLHVPWTSFSAVTNTVGPEAHEQWLQFHDIAADQTAQSLLEWFKELP